MRLEQLISAPKLAHVDSVRACELQEERSVNREPWAFALMAMVTSMNPSSSALERWGHYFPQSTTTGAEAREIGADRRLADVAAFVSAPDRIRDALRYLGLTKTQLKDICAISRQTLYDWLGGRFEPDAKNGARLRGVHELALLVPQHSRRPIRAAFVTQPVFGAASLLDMLQQPRLDMPMLRQVVIALAANSGLAEKRSASALRERLGFKKLSQKSQADNLADNVEGLGAT
jgi:hypothetical protein